MAYCSCCRSLNAQFAQPKVPDGLPAKATVCGICSRHLGDSPNAVKRRAQDHYEQWQEDIEILRRKHAVALAKKDQRIAELEATVEELQQELSDRPTQVVHENLDQASVNAAHMERARAQAARDSAYKLVAQIRVKHHDTGNGTCKCGMRVEKCEDTELINSDRSFLRWEAHQVEQVNRYGRFSSLLPQGHPALINPRWTPPEPQ